MLKRVPYGPKFQHCIFLKQRLCFVCFWRESHLPPSPVDQGLLIHEVCRSRTTTHHNRQNYSGRVINSSQRSVPDDTNTSQNTNVYASGGIRTHNLRGRAAAYLRLRERGHWDRQNKDFTIPVLILSVHNGAYLPDATQSFIRNR